MSATVTSAPSSAAPASTPSTSTQNSTSSAPKTSAEPKAAEKTSQSTSTSGGGTQESKFNKPESTSEPKEKTEPKVETKPEPKPESPRKEKLKVNGKEIELTAEEVRRKAELVEGAEQKFQEAAKMRKEMQDVVKAIKNDPEAVLKHFGVDPEQFATKVLSERVKQGMMTPEQRELEELRKFRSDAEAREKQTAEEQQRQQQTQAETQQRQQAAKYFDEEMAKALSAAKVPKSPYMVRQVAAEIYAALRKGYDLPVAEAVSRVAGRYDNDFITHIKDMDDASLVSLLDRANVTKRLRQYDLNKIKAKRNKVASPADIAESSATEPTRRSAPAPKEQMGHYEWLEHVRKKAGV